MFTKTRTTVKKYRHGNIPAAFGSDLWLSGSTNVPNLLLRFYKYMDITDSEMMLLIQLFRFRTEEKDLHPALDALSELLSASREEIVRDIKSLFEKKIITETLYYDESRDDVLTGYDFEPLFEKLSDYWACARAKEIEKTGSKFDQTVRQDQNNDILALSYGIFEKEFGRPISPIEMEKIAQWVESDGMELVQEALRRAVLLGKRNFRYIDTILLEWTRQNLKSIKSVEEYDRQHQTKRSSRDTNRRDTGKPEEGGSETNKRKAMIKKLYLS